MALTDRQIIAAGLQTAKYGVIDSSGFLAGSTASAPSAGDQDGVALGRLKGAKTIPSSVPDSEKVDATGDDDLLASFVFGSNQSPAGQIVVAVADFDFQALAQSTTVYAVGNVTMAALQPTDPTFADLVMLFQNQAKSQATGSIGAVRNAGVIVRATVTPLGPSDFTERAVQDERYGFTLTPWDTFPWGTSNVQASLGPSQASIVRFRSQYPMDMHRHTGDNSEVTFTLDNTPAAADGDSVLVWVDGALQTYTTDYTVNIGNKQVIFEAGSTPGSNAKIITWYEFTA